VGLSVRPGPTKFTTDYVPQSQKGWYSSQSANTTQQQACEAYIHIRNSTLSGTATRKPPPRTQPPDTQLWRF